MDTRPMPAADGGVKLSEEDAARLIAAQDDYDDVQEEARLIVLQAEARVAGARRAHALVLRDLARKYGFQWRGRWVLDHATCRLVPAPPEQDPPTTRT